MTYGEDDMTTINQKKLALARGIAVKLVVSGGMTENTGFAHRTLSVPFDSGVNHLLQIIPSEVHPFTPCWSCMLQAARLLSCA